MVSHFTHLFFGFLTEVHSIQVETAIANYKAQKKRQSIGVIRKKDAEKCMLENRLKRPKDERWQLTLFLKP